MDALKNATNGITLLDTFCSDSFLSATFNQQKFFPMKFELVSRQTGMNHEFCHER